MLSPEQQIQLGLFQEFPGQVTVDGLASPVCTYLGSSGIDYNIQFLPTEAQAATTLPGTIIANVDGFSAAQNIPDETMGGTPFCQLTIDVAASQSIRVQAKTRPGGPAPGIDEQCRRATEVASMVMTTVVATASR